MSRSIRFVLIIFALVIIPLIVLAVFYMDAKAEDNIQVNEINKFEEAK